MRRVLYIVDTLDCSGAANQLEILSADLSDRGFDVQVATLEVPKTPVPCKEACGKPSRAMPITALARRLTIDPLALLKLHRLIQDFQPDVVHTWNADAAIYGSAALITRRPRPRLIIGFDRIQPWIPSWEWSIARRLACHADHIVANSPNVRDWYAGRGLPANQFTVIPPGVPTTQPSDVSREDLLRELNLPSDAKLIGVIGRLVPENRVKDLIWAADLLRVLHDNLRLLIIGDGPLRAQLEEYARLASDLDHIQFLGERPDTWRIMPHLNVLWNGSENIGPSTTILNAMAAGVPVVASDTPTNRELVVENETGYLIPLGTRSGRAARARNTDRIFNDRELASRLSEAARKRATAQFAIEKCLQNHSKLYDAVR